MGKLYSEIDDRLRSFIEAQHVFFVATAPNQADGHVNCSPKGLDSLRVLGPNDVAYADFVGSGVETIAHVRQNGRIVIMFCAFEGPPRIVRLHGRGRVIEPEEVEFGPLLEGFGGTAGELGVRAVVRIEVTRISESCGFGVPTYQYVGQRDQIPAWAQQRGAAGIESYKREKNTASIDGLKGLGRIGDSAAGG